MSPMKLTSTDMATTTIRGTVHLTSTTVPSPSSPSSPLHSSVSLSSDDEELTFTAAPAPINAWLSPNIVELPPPRNIPSSLSALCKEWGVEVPKRARSASPSKQMQININVVPTSPTSPSYSSSPPAVIAAPITAASSALAFNLAARDAHLHMKRRERELQRARQQQQQQQVHVQTQRPSPQLVAWQQHYAAHLQQLQHKAQRLYDDIARYEQQLQQQVHDPIPAEGNTGSSSLRAQLHAKFTEWDTQRKELFSAIANVGRDKAAGKVRFPRGAGREKRSEQKESYVRSQHDKARQKSAIQQQLLSARQDLLGVQREMREWKEAMRKCRAEERLRRSEVPVYPTFPSTIAVPAYTQHTSAPASAHAAACSCAVHGKPSPPPPVITTTQPITFVAPPPAASSSSSDLSVPVSLAPGTQQLRVPLDAPGQELLLNINVLPTGGQGADSGVVAAVPAPAPAAAAAAAVPDTQWSAILQLRSTLQKIRGQYIALKRKMIVDGQESKELQKQLQQTRSLIANMWQQNQILQTHAQQVAFVQRERNLKNQELQQENAWQLLQQQQNQTQKQADELKHSYRRIRRELTEREQRWAAEHGVKFNDSQININNDITLSQSVPVGSNLEQEIGQNYPSSLAVHVPPSHIAASADDADAESTLSSVLTDTSTPVPFSAPVAYVPATTTSSSPPVPTVLGLALNQQQRDAHGPALSQPLYDHHYQADTYSSMARQKAPVTRESKPCTLCSCTDHACSCIDDSTLPCILSRVCQHSERGDAACVCALCDEKQQQMELEEVGDREQKVMSRLRRSERQLDRVQQQYSNNNCSRYVDFVNAIRLDAHGCINVVMCVASFVSVAMHAHPLVLILIPLMCEYLFDRINAYRLPGY